MITALVYMVIYLIVVGLICWLLLVLVDTVPLSEPFARVLRVLIMAIGIIIAILVLLNFIGVTPPMRAL